MTDGKDVRAVLYKRIGISLLAVAIAVSLTACGFLSIPSAVQELLSSGRRFPPLRRRLSMPGTMPEKRRLPPQEVNGSEPGAEKPPAPHQENKDQADGKPLSLFWAEDGDLGWKNGELLYTADWDMRLLENLWGMGLYEKFTEDGEKRRTVFTDPSSFTLYTLLEMLGTMWGTCEYQVDPATGLPAEKQPYFDLLNDNILTARIQVEAAILPEETREWIPAGT